MHNSFLFATLNIENIIIKKIKNRGLFFITLEKPLQIQEFFVVFRNEKIVGGGGGVFKKAYYCH